MMCGKCKGKMELRNFVGNREDIFIYECSNCGFILYPRLIMGLSDKLFQEFMNFKENSKEYMCPFCRDCKRLMKFIFENKSIDFKMKEFRDSCEVSNEKMLNKIKTIENNYLNKLKETNKND